MRTTSDLRDRAQWLLDQLPAEVLQRVVGLLEALLLELGSRPPDAAEQSGQVYDFSDLAGRLQWQGDAVEAQRSLRDDE